MTEQRFFPFSHSLERLFAVQWPMITNRYQRDYAWETEEIDEFVSDLRRLAVRRSSDKTYSHFFGAIVAVKHDREDYERPEFEIVDGQQRLATFSLFESALIRGGETLAKKLSGEPEETATNFVAERRRHYIATKEHNKAKVKDEPRQLFTVVDRDAAVFSALVSGTAPPTSDGYSHTLLISAHDRLYGELIRGFVEADDSENGLNDLIGFARAVEEGSEFIFIHTKTEHHATQLFSVLNDRGRRLEEADLLRAHTLMLVSGTDEEFASKPETKEEVAALQDQIAEAWDSIDLSPRKTVDAFLRHHYASVVGVRVSTASILKQYKNRFFADREEPVPPGERKSVVEIVQGIAESMALYEPISRGEWPFTEKEGALATPKWDRDRLYRLVRTLQSERVLPLLLSAASRGRAFLGEIVPGLERVEFRAIASGVEQNKMAQLYFDVAALVRSRAFDVNQALNEVEAWVSSWTNDEGFKLGLRSRLVYGPYKSTSYIKHFLTTLEDHRSWLKAGAAGDPKPAKLQPWDMGQVEDEHIFPQNPKEGLPEDMQPHVNRLGNQTFWGPGDNKRKEASNRLPTDPLKIDAYRKAQPKLTNDVGEQLAAHTIWGETQIEAREKQLVEDGAKVYAPSAAATGVAVKLGKSRSNKFSWRPSGDVRVWLVSSKPDSNYKDVDGQSYEYPSNIPNGQQIVPGDTIITFRPKQAGSKKKGTEELPARIFGVAVVERIEFKADGLRDAMYAAGTHRTIDPPIPIDDPSGTEPRDNMRNAINRVPGTYLEQLNELSNAGRHLRPNPERARIFPQ